jgi:hypothetical protein
MIWYERCQSDESPFSHRAAAHDGMRADRFRARVAFEG